MRIFPQLRTTLRAISGFFFFPILLYAQTPDCSVHWDAPVRISYDSIFYSTPRLSISGDTIHVTWFGTDFFGNVSHDGVQYSRSEDRGGSFTPPFTVASFDSALSPAVIASSGQLVFLAFEAVADTFSGTMLVRSTDAGSTWQPAQRFLRRSLPLLIESAGEIAYLHYYNRDSAKYGFRRSTDAGVTWVLQNNTMPELSSMFMRNNEIHAVSEVEVNAKEVYYLRSQDFGRTWQYMEVLSNEFDFTSSLYSKIAGNEKRDLYAVWNDTGSVYIRHSANNGIYWAQATKISDEDGAIVPDVGASREFVTAVWDNDLGGASTIHSRPSNDYGYTYCPLDHPAADSGTSGPSIKLAGNDVHLVWSTLEGMTGTIVYRHGTVVDNPNVQDHPPSLYQLAQNYPNPFNDVTRIRFELPRPSHVTLTVYDLLGRVVARLVDDERDVGRYEVSYTVTTLASGMYIYELVAGEYAERRKLLLLR